MFYKNCYNDKDEVYNDYMKNVIDPVTGDDYDDLNMIFIPDAYPLESDWFMGKYSSGLRGWSWKPIDRAIGAGVRIPPSPPDRSK